MNRQQYPSCIEACVKCAQACENCADACLQESDVAMMAECIRRDRDCAEACWGAAAFMSRNSPFAREFCRLCVDICEACGSECRTHDASHCQKCAEACETCADECRRMAGVTA